jgi:hypothetical protein
MALIDIDDFKEILGVGDLYDDALLESAMESAESVVLGFLNFHRASITAVQIKSNVATFTTRSPHGYVIGQQVTISKVGSPFDGTRTITKVSEYTFQASITNADVPRRLNVPDGDCILQGQSTYYDTNENCRTAALMIAVDIWNARQSASGQMQAVDFNPGPYRMGRSLLSRVVGLISEFRDPKSMVG